MLLSVTGFTLASLLCAVANNLSMLVLARAIQGISGAGLIPLSQATLLDINPPENHAKAMAIYGLGSMLGPLIGPTLGGWLTDTYSWRWVFLINLPFQNARHASAAFRHVRFCGAVDRAGLVSADARPRPATRLVRRQ